MSIAEHLSTLSKVDVPPDANPQGLTQPIWAYPRNDAGTAQAFADRFADYAKYSPGIGWLVWNGTYWERDTGSKVVQLAISLSREALKEAAEIEDEDKRKRATSHALNMGNKARVDAALSLARSFDTIATPPHTLDSDPYLLGCENGVIDLRHGSFRASDRRDLISCSTGVDWDDSATCPEWERFLKDVTLGDTELLAFLRRAIGYTLTGAMNEQCFFFLFGVGANGKSVLVETIEAMMGDYAHRASAELFEKRHDRNKAPELAELPGRRLILASETHEGSRLDERMIKDITGGETLRGEKKFRSGFPFRPSGKIWMSGNHKPQISGTDAGIWRRVTMIPFEASFDEKRLDPRMAEKLRHELPGILRWAVSGCLEWRKKGLDLPKKVRQAVSDYRCDEDNLGRFLEERIETAPGDVSMARTELYDTYRSWAEDEGLRYPMSKTKLSRRLKEGGYHLDGKRWRGLRPKDA